MPRSSPTPALARFLVLTSTVAALSACGGAAAQKDADWYYHWNCNGDSECLITNPAGTATGVADEGPVEVNCTQLLQFASHFWGGSAINWCDQSATSHGPVVLLWVTPVNATIAVGQTQQYTATGHYADGATVDLTAQSTWMAGDGVLHIGSTPVATITAGGLASAEAAGQIAISAHYGSLSGATVLYVSPAALESITVSPANPSVKQGLTQPLTATGHYSDGSTATVSAAAWSSSDTSIATIDATGLATTGAAGTITATASYHGISGSTQLTVVALQSITLGPTSPSVPVGRFLTLTATGHYADGSTGDLSTAATWTSATPAVATVSGPIVTGVSLGTSLVTARWGSISQTITVTVTSAALNSISVAPGTATIAVGGTQQFTATAHYSDGSSAPLSSGVSWSAFCVPACATIDTNGLATGTAVATALIGASYSGKTANASLTVAAFGAHWDVAYVGTTSVLSAVASNGSQVVAVGSNGVIYTSPDGLGWTSRTSGTSEVLRGVAWSGSTWVAVGGSGLAAVVLTSPDGVTWTPRSTTASYYFLSVQWAGSLFVAGCYDRGIWTSPDGITWTPRAGPTAWGNAFVWTGTRWVGGGNSLLTSPDGITWTTSAVTDTFHGIVWTGSQLVAVGGARTVGQPGSVSTSPDGLTWTEQSAGTTDTLYGVAWSGSMFAAVGVSSTDGTGGIVTSPDGVSWTPQSPGTTHALYGIAWTGTRLVAVGDAGVVLTSP